MGRSQIRYPTGEIIPEICGSQPPARPTTNFSPCNDWKVRIQARSPFRPKLCLRFQMFGRCCAARSDFHLMNDTLVEKSGAGYAAERPRT